jgi:hypothetical protein
MNASPTLHASAALSVEKLDVVGGAATHLPVQKPYLYSGKHGRTVTVSKQLIHLNPILLIFVYSATSTPVCPHPGPLCHHGPQKTSTNIGDEARSNAFV